MAIKVHGRVRSLAVRRVLACLHEKELDFESVPSDSIAGDLNPFCLMPAFEDGDLKMFESRAITNYIAKAYADKGSQLLYTSGKELAAMLQWMEVEAHQYDTSASKLVREHLLKPMVMGVPADPAVVEECEAKLVKVFDVYEARLGQAKYLAGDNFTLADLHHLPTLSFLMQTPSKKLVDSRPHVSAWVADISARPAWAKVVALGIQQ
ncbi:hypothetical protein Tsubulata_839797 [Turnera subulata]|nr:hypothetical protein Tsubulata_839797 [Turnera subulata]